MTKRKWAVILCGGRGSRMGSLTESIPKPLLLVHGKPIIWYSFLTLYKHGFRDFIFPIGYRGETIKSYILDTFEGLGCYAYFMDTGEDTPIASRIATITHLIPDREDFFLLNSDTIFDFNISAMLEQHRREEALVTLSSVEVISPWGTIMMKGDRVVGFDRERKIRYVAGGHTLGLVYSGMAWLNKDALKYVDLDTCGDFESSLYSTVIKMERIGLFHLQGVWFPIDTPKDLDIVNMKVPDMNGIGEIAAEVKERLAEIL